MRDWRAEIRSRLGVGNIHPANEAEIVEELGQHLEDQFAELRSRGVSDERATASLLEQLDAQGFPRDLFARHRARAGIPPAIVVGRNDLRGILSSVWQDVRYGFRTLRKAPAFAVVAVLSLGLGIGATTAIFGLLHALLLGRMSVVHPERLIAVQFTLGAKRIYHEFSFAEFTALKQAPGVPALAGSTGGGVSYVARNVRDYSASQHVTGGFFEILGVRPLLGRTLTPQDDATRAPVAVIGEDLWRDRFAGDPAVIGERIAVNDQPFTIVGVIPRSYRSLFLAGEFSIAIPLGARGLVVPPNSDGPPTMSLTVIGRLADGMTREQASIALDRAYRQCCPQPTRGQAASSDQPLLVAEDASRG